MIVTFTKTAAHRYSILVEGQNMEPVTMKHAPGYHPRLPHDAAHFIVESELGITGGIFGQLAAGGTARTFLPVDAKRQKKVRKRGLQLARANKEDAQFSEHAIWAAQARWEKHDIIPDTKVAKEDIDRIISRFEEFSKLWSAAPIGGSITLEWHPRRPEKRKR